MSFEMKNTKNKVKSSYKTLYISEKLIKQIEKLAKENNSSFNNAVISMIEHCLNSNENTIK